VSRRREIAAVWSLSVAAALAAGGCGGGSGKSSSSPNASNPGALSAEAQSAATGDIPDNQVFLVFRSLGVGGWSMKYPEGWVQTGSGARVVFRDKNNITRVFVGKGSAPTLATVRHDLAGLRGVHLESAPQTITLGAGRAVKSVYTTESAPSPVTGKRVTLLVDRYYLVHGGRRAIVDLGTPTGVDNVDAYRLMIQSFRWR